MEIGTIIEIGFDPITENPCKIMFAKDFIQCKVIFSYGSGNYIVFPTQNYSKYSSWFYPLDNTFLEEIKSIYDFKEISNIYDYIGTAHRIVHNNDYRIFKPKFEEDGCKCTKCKEFYPYAVANQSDGTLICYSCRDNPWR